MRSIVASLGFFVVCACCAASISAEASVFNEVSRETGVSARLLAAIALTESGRGGAPWPWTLNVEGRALYFADRHAAHAALVELLRRGYRSVDVGLMQVNLAYHGRRFENTWTALDPLENVRVAATILRENHRGTADAGYAVALYHSNTPARGLGYLSRVSRHYASLRTAATP